MAIKDKITSQEKDFSAWYNDCIRLADLADYGPVKGTMIIKPYGYAIWENIQRIFDTEIKKTGVENAYFPMFIPEKFLKKESEHIEGFSPELAVVTYAGGEKLQERIVVRPTSETIIYDAFSRWINSYRDLPYKVNQWANVVRWEKRTKLFVRTTEFLWQEGHTVFATEKEVSEETLDRLYNYEKFFRETLAIPPFIGRKSGSEKFAGALYTMSVESMGKDGKALQSATSHNLGQNFSKPFDIKFEDANGKLQYAWQSSWGLSTRIIGGIIMTHGDDKGLVLPPVIAPIQVVIIPIYKNDNEKKEVFEVINKLTSKTMDIRINIDDRENLSPGWKFNEWEIKGVPLRIEIGPRDAAKDSVTTVRRDQEDKALLKITDLKLGDILKDIQKNLLLKAENFKKENTYKVSDFKQFKRDIDQKKGFYLAPWCNNSKCEEKIKDETKATARIIPLENNIPGKGEKCLYCGKEATTFVYFAKAY